MGFLLANFIGLKPIQSYGNGNSSGLPRTSTGLLYTLYLSDVKVNWMDAMTLCSNRGMQLLTLPDPDIDFAVRRTLDSKGSFSVWTAAKDVDSTTRIEFKWATTNALVVFGSWRNGFPIDTFDGCVSATNAGACGREGTYGWDYRDCATLLYAMCQ